MTADTVPSPARLLRLAAITLVLAAGVMTGAQLGKIAPLIPWYRQDVGLSLVASGWLAASVAFFVAAASLPAGWAIDRIGLTRSVLIGSLALTLGGAALALASAPAAIFAARLVEAVGYLLLCIALPAVLNAVSPPRWKGPVLAIWSGFVPMGFAISDFLATAMLPAFAPPVFLMTVALLFGALAAAALALLRRHPMPAGTAAPGGIASTLSRQVLLLAVSFGVYVVLSVSMFTFMPSFVADAGSHYLVSAGAIALSVPLGNLLAGVLVAGRDARFMARLAIFGFAVSTATAVPAFTLASPLAATIFALALAISGALVASAQFAAIPFVTPRAGSVSVAIGLVAQAGGIGTLIGPPLGAAIIESAGWVGFGWFLAAMAAAGLACMAPLAFSAAEPQPAR